MARTTKSQLPRKMVPLRVTISLSSIQTWLPVFPDDTTLLVFQKTFLIIFRNDKFGIEVKKTSGFHGKVGKEVFLFTVNTTKPGSIRDGLHAVDLLNLIFIKMGEWENDGDRISGDQACGRGSLHPCIQALISVRRSPNARMAMVMPRMVRPVRSLFRKAFLKRT